MPVKTQHKEWVHIGHIQPQSHFYKHGMPPHSLWFHPDAPEPLCGETLAPQENIPDYRSTDRKSVV